MATGYEVVAAVDLNAAAAATYRANHPRARVHEGDIRELTGPALRKLAHGRIDVVAAGPPCQGFSIGGPRERSHPSTELLFEVARVIAELKPRAFMIENVPGLLSFQGGHVVDRFFRALARIDVDGRRYSVVLDAVDAADHGTPQHRKRIFICGVVGSTFVFPAPQRLHVSLMDAIGDLPEATASTADGLLPLSRAVGLTAYQKARRGGSRQLLNHSAKRLEEKRLERIAHIKEGQDKRALPDRLQAGGRVGKYRKLRGSRPAPTIVAHMAHDTASFIHPRYDRMLTVREAARLQGFDDHYRFVGSQFQQFRQVGNSVPPLVARDLAVALEPLVRRRLAPSRNRRRNGSDASVELALDVKVPEAEHQPASRPEPFVGIPVALLRAGDLRVPVGPGPTRREVVGMPVPEPPVDEHRDLDPPAEGDVRLARKRRKVASPAA